MDRHVANADKVAAWLADHPQVAWVSYARLPQNRTPLLEKYCPRGLGVAVHVRAQVGLRRRGADSSRPDELWSLTWPMSATRAA